MKNCYLLLLFFSAMLCGSIAHGQCALSGTYTINSAAATGGGNYQTFTAAVNALSSCGVSGPVIFNVVPGSGPYSEQISIPAITNASATNTITFNGNGETMSRSTTSSKRYIIRLYGADYITIKDLNIIPTGSYRFGVQFYNNADNNTISGCNIDVDYNASSSSYAGIVMSSSTTSATSASTTACDSNLIINNTINGGYYGITLVSSGTSSSNSIYNNKVIGNTIKNSRYAAVYLRGNNGAIIDSNDISRPDRTSTSTTYSIYVTSYNTNLRFNANRIHNMFSAMPTSTSSWYGIYTTADATSGNENIYSNNLIYDIEGNGAQYAIRNVGGAYNHYYYNTISLDYNSSSGSTYGFYQSTSASGILFNNNIVSITRGGSSTKYCFYRGTSSSPVTGDYNNYHINATNANIGYASGARATIPAWQGATSFDAHSVSIDPLFNNPSSGDYTPTNVALNSLADPVSGIDLDIIREDRHPVNPDMGAYEFLNCKMPKNLTVLSVTSNNAELRWNAVPASMGYEYVLDQNASAPTGSGTSISSNTHTAINLSANTTYYFHVRNKCSSVLMSDWVTIQVTTTFNPCPYPNGINVTPTSLSTVDFSWAAVSGSAGYEYVIDQIRSNPVGYGTATTNTMANDGGLTTGQTYYLHLRSQCSGGAWSDWTIHQFTMPVCDQPSNIIVSNITDVSADVIWSIMSGSSSYQYQIDQSRTPPVGGTGVNVTTGMSAHFNGLVPDTKYYIHIRSMCFVSDTSAWALDSFETRYGCGAPQLGVNNPNTSNPDAYWDPVPSAIGYEYAVTTSAMHPAFGTDIFGTSLPVSLPLDGKEYYLHVRTKCNSMFTFSEWSTIQLREEPNNINALNQSGEVIVYPNPANNTLNIVAEGFAEKGTIYITNMTGKKVKEFVVTSAEMSIDISDIPSGVYLLVLKNNGRSALTKFNKL